MLCIVIDSPYWIMYFISLYRSYMLLYRLYIYIRCFTIVNMREGSMLIFLQSVSTSGKHPTQKCCFLMNKAFSVWIDLPSSRAPWLLLLNGLSLKTVAMWYTSMAHHSSTSPPNTIQWIYNLSSVYVSTVSWGYWNPFITQSQSTVQLCGLLHYYGL